ncbi:hypothetical protein B0G57_11995 [Trinickia symbiotica]|uniref:Uncharacterized protein n=1 Tax=Trinickia symbiotica TaxID=863227 RepID=A0A2N7WVG9_9BURK|nr:hypothetical protein [Trinickia symbiotica]PMS33351.1 hypothetical protein C0Z20_24120 [Trinickia symbiotica]PPK42437.1 hypothetical protein B0G57_11995 [Trinickia symbiotica]
MTHTLIGVMTVACVACALPLAAQAADDGSLAMPDPLAASSQSGHDGYSMLRVKSGLIARDGGSKISPALFGPNAIPNWKAKDLLNDFSTPRLEGERFRFR